MVYIVVGLVIVGLVFFVIKQEKKGDAPGTPSTPGRVDNSPPPSENKN